VKKRKLVSWAALVVATMGSPLRMGLARTTLLVLATFLRSCSAAKFTNPSYDLQPGRPFTINWTDVVQYSNVYIFLMKEPSVAEGRLDEKFTIAGPGASPRPFHCVAFSLEARLTRR
jgi:hypothetical protein